MIEAGANTFRFNFSHGDHQEQGERMATVKRAEEIAGKKLVSFLILKVQKSVLNCSKAKLKSTHTKTGERIRVCYKTRHQINS